MSIARRDETGLRCQSLNTDERIKRTQLVLSRTYINSVKLNAPSVDGINYKIVTEAGFGQKQKYGDTHLLNSCTANSFIMWYTTERHLKILQDNVIKIIKTNMLRRIHITSLYFLFHCRYRELDPSWECSTLFFTAVFGYWILLFKMGKKSQLYDIK